MWGFILRDLLYVLSGLRPLFAGTCCVVLDPSVQHGVLTAHTDAVWGLCIHSSKSHLLSCSADGTVRLWSPSNKTPLLNTFWIEDGG